MAVLTEVTIGALRFERFQEVLPDRFEQIRAAADHSRALLAGRVLWNVNSTARGGGVAELLISLLAYARGAGINARWEVIAGNPDFFVLTKRIHNHLHNAPGDHGRLGAAERSIYESALEPNIREFCDLARPEDVVIVHDPQPAGMIPALKKRIGCSVIWRCHVGIDVPSELARRAWAFLQPYVQPADAHVFSREAFVWEGLDRDRIRIISPVIDAFSAKNQYLDEATVGAILRAAGLADDGSVAEPRFVRRDGTAGRVDRQAQVWEERKLRPDDEVVLQVSRWDRLKDPIGVIEGFAKHVAPKTDAQLVYAGPAVEAVADDPEGGQVLREAQALCERLPGPERGRVHLACLPLDDLEENAAIVNALQRRADVVVQKSIAEGFGLTVAEAMWKARPVVASRIGGIQDQIVDGVSGVLLDDARDLQAYGAAVRGLLEQPEKARAMGQKARERVRDEFLAVRSLMQYLSLIETLVG